MKPQKLLLATVICTLLSSFGSVASTHVYSPGLSAQSLLRQSSADGIRFESGIAATTITPGFSGVAEFAKQVNGFQGGIGSGLTSSKAGFSIDRTRIASDPSLQYDVTAVPLKSNGVTAGDSGTLVLITLGCAALAWSRRRIKVAAIASRTQDSYRLNSEATAAHKQNTAFSLDMPEINASANDPLAEDESDTPKPVVSAECEPDRNPYPELALSVQKLEALAHEMADLD